MEKATRNNKKTPHLICNRNWRNPPFLYHHCRQTHELFLLHPHRQWTRNTAAALFFSLNQKARGRRAPKHMRRWVPQSDDMKQTDLLLFGSSMYYFERVQLLLGEDKEHTISAKRQPQSSRIRRVVARLIQDDDAMHIGTGEVKAKLRTWEALLAQQQKSRFHTRDIQRETQTERETERRSVWMNIIHLHASHDSQRNNESSISRGHSISSWMIIIHIHPYVN